MANIPQKLIAALLIILAIPFAIYAGTLCGSENLIYLTGIMAVAMGLIVLVQPILLMVGVLVLYQSGIQMPGLGKLDLFMLTAMALVVVVIVRACMQQKLHIQFNLANLALMAFLLVIAMIMIVRGSGFKFLGSSLWGGFGYVKIFVMAFLALLMPSMPLKSKYWLMAVLGMGAVAFLPAIVELLVLKSPLFYPLALFIKPSDQIGMSITADLLDSGVVRYYSFGDAALFSFLAVAACVDLRKTGWLSSFLYYVFFFCSFLLTSLSGFRIRILALITILGGVFILHRALTLYKVLLLCVVTIFFYIFLVQYTEELPLSIQRAVSFIPGVETNIESSQDAKNTLEWRLELWKMGLDTLPKYWLIGKGYVFEASDMDAAYQAKRYQGDEYSWAMVSSSYHNGPLSLLLGLGIFGVISGVAFLIFSIFRHWKFYRQPWNSRRLQVMHIAFYAYYLMCVVFFLLLYGDVAGSFPALFFAYAILETLVVSEKHYGKFPASQ